jgi:hypothetical protein
VHFTFGGLDLDVFWWRCDVVYSPPAATAEVESRTVLGVM